MAIEKRWINWATSVTSAILLVFSLALVVVAFYMNLTSVVNQNEKLAISGAALVSLGVLVFPAAWVGFAAAISRHRGVYIAFMVMVCLSLLDAIGMLVYQTYRFDFLNSYTDSENGIAIAVTILQSILIPILFFGLAFGVAALCYENPRHAADRKAGAPYSQYPGFSAPPPPIYSREYGPPLSLPRPSGYDYATEPRMYYSKGRY